MRPKAIPSFLFGLALAALVSISVPQLIAVGLLVRTMTDVLGIIGGLF